MRTFVVLYVTVGLGQPLGTTTSLLGVVAGGYVVAALVSGPLGDRFGLARVILLCSIVYGSGLLLRGPRRGGMPGTFRSSLSSRSRAAR